MDDHDGQIVKYEDGDGDHIMYQIEHGKLVKYVNGVKRVGGREKLDSTGVVTTIKFSAPLRIADQTGLQAAYFLIILWLEMPW